MTSGGLYLEVSPSGGRWWRLKYYKPVAKTENRLSLGTYPEIGLKEARARRDEARKLVSQGIDPSDHRKTIRQDAEQRVDNSFETVSREWFDKQKPRWVEGHSLRLLRLLERDIFPFRGFGGRPISSITPPDVLAALRPIEARTAETAHRAQQLCSQIFRYAIATGTCKSDPTRDLRGALAPVPKRHFAATTEPKRFGAILRAIDTYEGTLVVSSALRLAPLLFIRPGELRTAAWADINLKNAEWRYRVTKTEVDHIVPLSRQTLAIPRPLHDLTGQGMYVFPGARSRKRPMSDNAILVALRAMEIGRDEMTGHGFRAVARTILDEILGFRPDIIEHQLAHSVKDPNGRAYNRTSFLPERREMMQKWARYPSLRSKG
jgi:integrase